MCRFAATLKAGMRASTRTKAIYSGMRKRNARETGIFTTALIEDADYD